MKKLIGFILILVVLVAVSGCTQTSTPPATTVATTAPAVTETPVETTLAPVETTAEPTTEVPVATTAAEATPTEAVANVTPVATEVPAANVTVAPALTYTLSPVIHIVNNSFSPSTIQIYPGTGVAWVNDDASVHSVRMIGKYAGKFNSGDIAKGAQWRYDFGDTEATYQYADGYNVNVTGIIIVKKGSSFAGVGTQAPYVTSNATW